jgi:hypothetical protein
VHDVGLLALALSASCAVRAAWFNTAAAGGRRADTGVLRDGVGASTDRSGRAVAARGRAGLRAEALKWCATGEWARGTGEAGP